MDLMLTLTFYLGGMSASCLTMHLHLRLYSIAPPDIEPATTLISSLYAATYRDSNQPYIKHAAWLIPCVQPYLP